MRTSWLVYLLFLMSFSTITFDFGFLISIMALISLMDNYWSLDYEESYHFNIPGCLMSFEDVATPKLFIISKILKKFLNIKLYIVTLLNINYIFFYFLAIYDTKKNSPFIQSLRFSLTSRKSYFLIKLRINSFSKKEN